MPTHWLTFRAFISTDFSDQQVRFGQTLSSRYVGIPIVGTFSTPTGYPKADSASVSAVPITINQHKCIEHKCLELALHAEQLSGPARDLFTEELPAISYALAKDLVDYVYALITTGNFTATPTSEMTQNFGRPTPVDMGALLDNRGVPVGSTNRTALLNTAYFAALQKDPSIMQLAAFQAREYIEENQLPSGGGFSIPEASNLPTTNNLAGFAFSRSALVAASRVPVDYSAIRPGANYGNVHTVSDPSTGAAMVQTSYVNHTLGAANFRLEAWTLPACLPWRGITFPTCPSLS